MGVVGEPGMCLRISHSHRVCSFSTFIKYSKIKTTNCGVFSSHLVVCGCVGSVWVGGFVCACVRMYKTTVGEIRVGEMGMNPPEINMD